MNGKFHYLNHLRIWTLAGCGSLALGAPIASCKDPTPGFDPKPIEAGAPEAAATINEDCPADDTWLPNTPPVRMFTPPPHPDTECPFYRGAYQNFLIATQPLANGDPALVQYATLDDAFIHQSTPKLHAVRNTSGRAWLGAIKQAGQRNVLVDQDHHTLYYGLHMNQAFVDFIKANNLQTVDAIKNVDPNLSFPPGLVEFKTAWKDIDPQDFPNGVVPPPGNAFPGDPGDYSNYITTMAWVPHLKVVNMGGIPTLIEEPNNPVLRKVALVAIHCVYTLPGHPEFVWGSIQHVNTKAIDPAIKAYANVEVLGAPDSTPDTTGPGGVPQLPSLDDQQNNKVTDPVSSNNYLLYHGGTPEREGDQPTTNSDLANAFDEPSQSFMGVQNSIYRMFPGSKSTTLQPDSAVFSLNSNLNVLFDKHKNDLSASDRRVNYRLVAAIWMDKPALFGLGPDGKGMSLQNDDTSPLVIAAKKGDPLADISQGNFCGTPLDSTNTSGDSPNANGTNNTVPGCVTRADSLMQIPPADPSSDFANQVAGTDSEFSLLGGEDRLSSTAMETFTQNGTFKNCFTCHNTQPITTNGTPYTGDPSETPVITKPALINVSHLFSEFVLREQDEAAEAAAGN
jgi:hypothetical protein